MLVLDRGRDCPPASVHAAAQRSTIKDRRLRRRARSRALVVDRENDVVGLIGQARPKLIFAPRLQPSPDSRPSASEQLARCRARGDQGLLRQLHDST